MSRIHLFELATGKECLAWTVQEPINCLAFSPDGRVLATGSRDAIRFWSVATGQELFRHASHDTEVSSLRFAPDGGTLASALQDTTVLVWELPLAIKRADPPAKALRPADLDALWTDLADTDAVKGQTAVWTLAAASRDSVPFVAKHVRPAMLPSNEQLTRWIADLDRAVFADRETATRELERQAELAEPRLRKALAADPSPEARRRIEVLLKKLEGPLTSGETLRSVRAVEVLEHIGTPEARELLRKLAAGASEARLTREANAALERCSRSPTR